MNCVYMLLCNDQSFYTGWTNDLAARLAAHDEGTASKYTRSKRPLQCILVIYCNSATQARSVEAKIKRLQRKQIFYPDTVQTVATQEGAEIAHRIVDSKGETRAWARTRWE
jgi:putative endonuclease